MLPGAPRPGRGAAAARAARPRSASRTVHIGRTPARTRDQARGHSVARGLFRRGARRRGASDPRSHRARPRDRLLRLLRVGGNRPDICVRVYCEGGTASGGGSLPGRGSGSRDSRAVGTRSDRRAGAHAPDAGSHAHDPVLDQRLYTAGPGTVSMRSHAWPSGRRDLRPS